MFVNTCVFDNNFIVMSCVCCQANGKSHEHSQFVVQFKYKDACDNFVKKQYYNVHRNSAFTWFVLNKAAGTMPLNTDNTSKIKFDRVRTVLIDANQFMTCSCGNIQRFLLPCCHVCAVLKDLKYYEPSLFHIRWH